ncbi:cell wall protein DAN4-like isoform X2 [Photinus pyralis]|uniref:cell wall protein DAN4-like isoform X2 n=1 Tax=Photinus pyralis TaxID=7054 RepID=UPI00126775BF|nr:cell wall protein DAN4-like isoform X2 [Photinus pyralis]
MRSNLLSSTKAEKFKWRPSYSYPQPIPQDIMVDSVNYLGLVLLQAHNHNNGNNIALSPYGAASVLVALAEGLQGRALDEISRASLLPLEFDVMRVGLRDIHRHLKSYFIPEEGFLAGLTFSHENVTLKSSYESILRFYGYDVDNFNSALYPTPSTTTSYASQNATTSTSILETKINDVSPTTTPSQTHTTVYTQVTNTMTTESNISSVSTNSITATTTCITNAPSIPSTITANIPSTNTVMTSFPSSLTTTTPRVTTTTPSTTNTKPTTVTDASITEQPTTSTTQLTATTEATITTTTTEPTITTETTSTSTTTTEPTITTEIPSTLTTTTKPTTTVTTTTTVPTTTTSITPAATLSFTTTPTTISIPTTTTSTPTTTTVASSNSMANTMTTKMQTSTATLIVTETASMSLETSSITDTTDSSTSEATITETISTESTIGQPSSTTETEEEKPREKRSVVDYLIAKYYDSNEPAHIISRYEPSHPTTFLVNGRIREPNINFMTYDTVLPFRYISYLNALALTFPLDSTKYYLLLVLPIDETGIDILVDNIISTTLKQIISNLQPTRVKATIPSFTLKGYVVLTPTLQKMGIKTIFEPRRADFSRLTDDKNIYVTNIEQAITVTIRNYVDPSTLHNDENYHHRGPVVFNADHPFLYFVMDSQIHVALMAGKIVNPLNSRIR